MPLRLGPDRLELPAVEERPVAWRFEVGEESWALLGCGEPPCALPPGLTPAEAEVARLAAAGLSSGQIAGRRGTAIRTVANQLAGVYRKLGVGSRTQLLACLRAGAGRGR